MKKLPLHGQDGGAGAAVGARGEEVASSGPGRWPAPAPDPQASKNSYDRKSGLFITKSGGFRYIQEFRITGNKSHVNMRCCKYGFKVFFMFFCV